jgi:hypothetical protein
MWVAVRDESELTAGGSVGAGSPPQPRYAGRQAYSQAARDIVVRCAALIDVGEARFGAGTAQDGRPDDDRTHVRGQLLRCALGTDLANLMDLRTGVRDRVAAAGTGLAAWLVKLA